MNTNFNQYFTHDKIPTTGDLYEKEQYFEEVEEHIREATELLGSLLYDLKATIYNHPYLVGFENSPPNDWKDEVISGLQAKAHDAACIVNNMILLDTFSGMDFNPDMELRKLMHEWDKEEFVDKLANA